MKQETSIIILGAGDMLSKRVGVSACLYLNDANLADGSQLARKRIIDHYKQQDVRRNIYLVTTRENGGIRAHVSNSEIDIIYIEKQSSIIESIKQVIDIIDSSHILIQPITTLPTQEADQKTWIELSNKAIPRENWSAVFNPKHSNPQFLFKNSDVKDESSVSYPFTGIINAPTQLIKQIIHTQKLYNQLIDKTDLLYLAKVVWQMEKAEFRLTEWHDLGHYSTYSQTSARRLESRSFNSLKLDADKNIVCKSSTDIIRLRGEATYLEKIDENLKRFFPRILGYKENKSIAEIQMEYIPYPNVSELFLHWCIGRNTWFNIMKKLNLLIAEIRFSGANSDQYFSANSDWLYSKKLNRRLEDLRSHQPDTNEIVHMGWNTWSSKEFSLNIVNSKTNTTKNIRLPELNKSVSRLIEDLYPYEKDCKLSLIHGDLCFNNILVEPMSCSIIN